MMPPIQTDLLTRLPRDHVPATEHERTAARQRRALRRVAGLRALTLLRALLAGAGRAWRRGVAS